MRRLIYLPIIHTDADMGSLASALDQSTATLCGEERWERHRTTASEFWQTVADYLGVWDAKSLRIYQDGFVSKGDLGKKIVEEGVKRGSKNYEIILSLVNRGAELVSTESTVLLQEEYNYISEIVKADTPSQQRLAYRKYQSRKDELTKQRDQHIAKVINATLKDGKVGLLFLGADHEVVPLLAKDITVEQFKDRGKIKAYFDELIYGHDDENLERLSKYLTSSVGAGIP